MNNTDKRAKYNESRKKKTRKKLMDGVRAIARSGDKVTKYSLSKKTGVSRRIIDNYPEILEAIENANLKHEKNNLENQIVEINVSEINDLEYARVLIDSLVKECNDTKQKLSRALEKITQRDSKISKLKDEVAEMKQYIQKIGDKND